MGKIKYLFKRIIKMDYKNMFRIAKAISKKTKKNYISIVIDMIKCGFNTKQDIMIIKSLSFII